MTITRVFSLMSASSKSCLQILVRLLITNHQKFIRVTLLGVKIAPLILLSPKTVYFYETIISIYPGMENLQAFV